MNRGTVNWIARRSILAGLLVLSLSGEVFAEPSNAFGSNTGDGSTAFTGLAQAPEANLFVGASTTSIPIEVPPGRKNLTPKLALTYSSSGGPSPYGYGWDLSLGKIQRSTKHGVPLCTGPYVEDFVLVLPGANVECTLDTHSYRCNPLVEEAFLRIQFFPVTRTGRYGTRAAYTTSSERGPTRISRRCRNTPTVTSLPGR